MTEASPRTPGSRPARRRFLTASVSVSAGWLLAGGAGAAVSASAPASAPAGAPALPIYPTKLPGALTLKYDLSYGLLGGRGLLTWQPPAGGRYRLNLVGRALGLKLLEWQSEGSVDPAGLAPGRFAERRIGKDERVAEFHREAGVVRYPGDKHADLPFPPGAQDRLSWLVQLPAVLAANEALRAPGQAVSLFVVGVGGKGEPWTFIVEDQRDGLVHLRRRTASGSEVVGEAWLSPEQQWMPQRVRLAQADGGDALELTLRR